VPARNPAADVPYFMKSRRFISCPPDSS
jgi:hypothetical protein